MGSLFDDRTGARQRTFRLRRLLPAAVLPVLLVVSACAQALPGGSPTPRKIVEDTSGAFDGARYQLSDAEKTLDCKKLAGRMQVRILQVRDDSQQTASSVVSQTMQSAVVPVFGGTDRGLDPARSRTRDLAMLQAYNEQLKAKGCGTFDLAAELNVRDVRHTPRPVPKP